jgi:septal ring factor EnvC (AmiA/AmiB activator)
VRRRPFVPLLLALAAATALSLAGVVGTRHLDGVDARLAQLESGLAQGPRARRELAQELALVRAELDSVRAELDEARATEIEAHLLAGRIAGAVTRVVDSAGVIEAHDT